MQRPFIRYAAYGALVATRLAGLVLDRAFPIYDGVTYFTKAVWMSCAPFSRGLTSQAFSHAAFRPPGSSWLAMPFVMAHPSFLAFVLALSFWLVVFIEIGVRGMLGPREASLRNAVGVSMAFGILGFLAGADLFFVDALFAAQSIAALGLATALLRRVSLGRAAALGIVLALALWTKPTGLPLMLTTCGALACALAWQALRRRRLRMSRRMALAFAAMLAPMLLALATLFFTDYSAVLTHFREPMSQRTISRVDIRAPLTAESAWRTVQMTVEDLGPVTAVALVVVGFAALWMGRRALRRRGALFVLGCAYALAWAVFLYLLPLKLGRYFAPLSGAAIGCFALALSLARRSGHVRFVRRSGAAVACIAVVWAGLCVAGVVPVRDWVRGHRFRNPMGDELADAHGLLSLLKQDGERVIFCVDALREADILWSASQMLNYEIEPAMEFFGVRKPFTVLFPPFPHYGLDHLARFGEADVLLAAAPVPFDLPAGSTSADWQAMNALLWRGEIARQAGWREVERTARRAVYVSGIPEGEPDGAWVLASLRARFLADAPLGSQQGRRIAAAQRSIAALRGMRPAGREFAPAQVAGDMRGFLLHAEYAGNPLPWGADLAVGPGDALCLEAREADLGDGTILRVQGLADDGLSTVSARNIAVPMGARFRVPVSEGESAVGHVRLRLEAGPQGNTYNDCVAVGVDAVGSIEP